MTNTQEIIDKWTNIKEMKHVYDELNKIKTIYRDSIDEKDITDLFEQDPIHSQYRSANNIYLVVCVEKNYILRSDYLITPFGKFSFGGNKFEAMTKASKLFMDSLSKQYNVTEIKDLDCYYFDASRNKEPFQSISFKENSNEIYYLTNLTEKIYTLTPLTPHNSKENVNDTIFYDIKFPNDAKLSKELFEKLKQ
jgi:hypothetical protein